MHHLHILLLFQCTPFLHNNRIWKVQSGPYHSVSQATGKLRGLVNWSFQRAWQHAANSSSRAGCQTLRSTGKMKHHLIFQKSPATPRLVDVMTHLHMACCPIPQNWPQSWGLLNSMDTHIYAHETTCSQPQLILKQCTQPHSANLASPLLCSCNPINYSICPFSGLQASSSQAFTSPQTLEIFRVSAVLPQLSAVMKVWNLLFE